MPLEQLPQITHVYQNHHMDSTRWRDFVPRNDDIVISTSIKSGTTWTQAIVRELIAHSLDDHDSIDSEQMSLPGTSSSPWLDATFSKEIGALYAMLDAQKHRRYIKTHLPLDGLPYFPQVKYLIIGRDPRDVFMSLWNHYGNYTDDLYSQLNNASKLIGKPCPRCPADIHEFWRKWITQGWFEWEQEGYPFWGNMHHTQTWWNYRHLENIDFFHFADLLANPDEEIGRMADFLDIGASAETIATVVKHTSLTALRNRRAQNPTKSNFTGGAKTFFFKGTNGRWRDVLSADELAMYEKTRSQVLSNDCVRWLECGRAR